MKTTNLGVEEFIKLSGADDIVLEIKEKISIDGQIPVYSDLYKDEDGERYQYVNYVQEGGGVLGIGLIGYTYVLEKLGFRFIKLAGTSAGAINTVMLAAVNKKNPEYEKYNTKSEMILHEMLNYDLWKLVDGNILSRYFIKLLMSNKRGLIFLKWLLIGSFIIPALTFIALIINDLFSTSTSISIIIDDYESIVRIINITCILILFLSALLFTGYIFLFRKANFGLNPGNSFREWITSILKRNHITSSKILNEEVESTFKDLKLHYDEERLPEEANTEIAPPYLTLVASDITNETKVEFPSMAKDYWDAPESINPADFVRASMSIPIFFSPFKVQVSQQTINKSKLHKSQLVEDQYNQIKQGKKNKSYYTVMLIDGGILSNFPINIFHNPKIKIARMPTFGAKLEDEVKRDAKFIEKRKIRFFSFLKMIFSTVRYYYDRDFLKKNEIYEMSIGHIDVADFNWLDFGLDSKSKIELFRRGAEAAKTFFLGGRVWIDGRCSKFEAFNWEKFKRERCKLVNNNMYIKQST